MSILSKDIDFTLHFIANYARKGLFLSEHFNATMYNYRDIENFLTKKRSRNIVLIISKINININFK